MPVAAAEAPDPELLQVLGAAVVVEPAPTTRQQPYRAQSTPEAAEALVDSTPATLFLVLVVPAS